MSSRRQSIEHSLEFARVSGPQTTPDGLPVRLTLPIGYEPRYPYPLMVLFHGRGGNEEQIQQCVRHLSARNYLTLSMRGPEVLGRRPDLSPACSWGDWSRHDARIEESLMRALLWVRRSYHIHSERIYLGGVCEGAGVAYRIGLSQPSTFGGVVALNGQLPLDNTCGPLFRLPEVRDFRVFIGHGIANAQVPLTLARQSFRALYAAGADVRLLTYPTTHRLHVRMFHDVNQWVIDRINAEHDALVLD